MDAAPVVFEVLTGPSGRAAVAVGDTGSVVRIVRKALLLRQIDLASRTGYSQATISRVEQGAIRDRAVLADVGEALGIPGTVLGLGEAPKAQPASSTLDGVDRRDVVKGVLAVASAAMLPAPVASHTPGRIGASAISGCWSALHRLYQLDDYRGGAAVYELTSGMATRLRHALDRATYSPATGRKLRAVTAATMAHAGWQALDAGRPDAARHWWLETLHLADLEAGADDARVTAYASMALLANRDPRNGRDAIGLAQTGARAAGASASPAMLSLLAARESVGFAGIGDRAGASQAMSRARRLLEQGRRGDEPEWLSFWGAADLECHQMTVFERLGQPMNAVASAREAVRLSDPVMPRNKTIYQAYLGSRLVRTGHLDEAIAVSRDALRGDAVDGSGRITAELRTTASLLADQEYEPARTFAAATNSLLPA